MSHSAKVQILLKNHVSFPGVYCTCNRPYPDPEDPVDDLMIQCVVCEDWFHGRHTNMPDNKLPDEELYAEMVCFQCVGKLGEQCTTVGSRPIQMQQMGGG